MAHIPAEWSEQIGELLTLLDTSAAEGASAAPPDEAERETRFLQRIAALDPDLLRFLVERLTEQATPQSAALLDALAQRSAAPDDIREQARTARDTLAARGVHPEPTGSETFYAGWVQQGRERGEQIMLLCWRLADGGLEGMIFLLDWRGDGLKDFYRTRPIHEAEWDELVRHNGEKGAPLTPATPAEARYLLDLALEETRRFSRPTPREYRLEGSLIERRMPPIDDATRATAAQRSYLGADLTPQQVVSASIAALHYRDYHLVAQLLAPTHPLRATLNDPTDLTALANALRAQIKHAPRREADAKTTPIETSADLALVEAQGGEVRFERTGRRVRTPTHERYTLQMVAGQWRIAHSESLAEQ